MRRQTFTILFLFIAIAMDGPLVHGVASQASDEIAVRTASVDGLALQYLEAGRGPTVVLLHGYTENQACGAR